MSGQGQQQPASSDVCQQQRKNFMLARSVQRLTGIASKEKQLGLIQATTGRYRWKASRLSDGRLLQTARSVDRRMTLVRDRQWSGHTNGSHAGTDAGTEID